MANGSNGPFGFMADKAPHGMQAPTMECVVLVGNAQEIGRGDPVTPDSGGGVGRAAHTDVFLGVAESAKYLDANNLRTWEPWIDDSKAGFVNVHWHPLQKYLVQGDVTALAQTQVWNNADTCSTVDPSSLGISQYYLDIAGTLNTTNTLGWKIVGYPRGTGGSNAQGGNSSKIGDTYPLYTVICNRRYLGNQIAGV